MNTADYRALRRILSKHKPCRLKLEIEEYLNREYEMRIDRSNLRRKKRGVK